jgi:hypothetical protein
VILLEDHPGDRERKDDAVGIAAELAARIGGKNVTHKPLGDSIRLDDLAPGEVCITPTLSWQALAASDPPEGAALMMVLGRPPRPRSDEDEAVLAIREARI